MNHKFVLEFDCAGINEADMGVLIRDALTSFVITRIPPLKYIQERYPYITDKQQKEKIKQVNARLDLVDQIRNSLTIDGC